MRRRISRRQWLSLGCAPGMNSNLAFGMLSPLPSAMRQSILRAAGASRVGEIVIVSTLITVHAHV